MELQVQAMESPRFTFHPGSIQLELLNWTIKASAILPNATRAPLFTLNVVSTYTSCAIEMDVNVFLSSDKLML